MLLLESCLRNALRRVVSGLSVASDVVLGPMSPSLYTSDSPSASESPASDVGELCKGSESVGRCSSELPPGPIKLKSCSSASFGALNNDVLAISTFRILRPSGDANGRTSEIPEGPEGEGEDLGSGRPPSLSLSAMSPSDESDSSSSAPPPTCFKLELLSTLTERLRVVGRL